MATTAQTRVGCAALLAVLAGFAGSAHAAVPVLGVGGSLDTFRHDPLVAIQCSAVSGPHSRFVLTSVEFNGAERTRSGFVGAIGIGMLAAPEARTGGPVGALALGAQIKAFDVDIAPGVYLATSFLLRGTADVSLVMFGTGETVGRTGAEGAFALELGSFQSYSARLHVGWNHPVGLPGNPVLRLGAQTLVPLDAEAAETPDDFAAVLATPAERQQAELAPTAWGPRARTTMLVVGVGLDRELLGDRAADTLRVTVGILYP